jgi:DNA adenine methylase
MSYDGGKGGMGVWQWIINNMPPHEIYVEPFLGDGAIMRHKRPARRSIGVEINPAVVAERWQGHGIPGAVIICGDAIKAIDRPWPENTLIYLDPPYLMSTRSSQRQLYTFELAERHEHIALLDLARRLRCMVAISGYESQLYAEQLLDWRTSSFWTVNRAGRRVQEWLWMNYPAPLELHDYRFLGKNFRERERIKRKKQRWAARLKSMPELERYALMDAIASLGSSSSPDVAMEGPLATSGEGIPSLDPARDAGAALELASADHAMPPTVANLDMFGDGRRL